MPVSRVSWPVRIGLALGLTALGLTLILSLLPSVAWRRPATSAPPPAPGALHRIRVMIDPGHGGVDSGCCSGDIMEKDLNLMVAKALQSELEQLDASVGLTRTTDEALAPYDGAANRHRRDLAARIAKTRDFAADIYISLHVNSGASRLGGSLTFYRKGDEESRRLAALVQERMRQVVPGNQNGILPASFMVLTSLGIPAILVETGFLSNSQDRERLLRPGAAYPLAAGIAAGLVAYIQGQAVTAPTISPFPAPAGDDPHDWLAPVEACNRQAGGDMLAPQ